LRNFLVSSSFDFDRPVLIIVFPRVLMFYGYFIGRISTSPTSALFTSRDQESLNRALMLRRLSFVIWCGTVDQYLPQLPNVQEKLVELLKLSTIEQVHPEVSRRYCCCGRSLWYEIGA